MVAVGVAGIGRSGGDGGVVFVAFGVGDAFDPGGDIELWATSGDLGIGKLGVGLYLRRIMRVARDDDLRPPLDQGVVP